MIPIAKYVVDDETKYLVNQVLESGRLSQGPMVEEFEDLVAKASNTKYCVAVSNGTVALEAMLRAAEVKNKTVLTTPLTFRATPQAIRHAGAIPIYADVDDQYLCLDRQAQHDIIVPVDLYGQKSHHQGGNVFCDAAQSIGLDHSRSHAASISFYTGKNIGTGEGGAVVTNDENIAQQIRLWRNQGMTGAYDYRSDQGFNWRMTELAAAVGIPQMKKLAYDNAARGLTELVYRNRFKDLPLTLPKLSVNSSWHQFTCRSPYRDQIVKELNEANIEARIYYPELVSPKDSWEQTPIALQATKEIFSIPVHHHLTEDEIVYIADKVTEIVSRVSQ